MNVVYQIPFLDTLNAARTIYNGYKNAFEDSGHLFLPFTAEDNLEELFEKIQPNIFITSLHKISFRFFDINLLKKYRKRGLKVFINIPFWQNYLRELRINESPGLKTNNYFLSLIKSDSFFDFYFSYAESNDPRFEGFTKETGHKIHTIPLAADKRILFQDFDEKFKADISFLGTYLPGKIKFFKTMVFPLKARYDLKIYGQDWYFYQRLLSWAQKFGQFFNLPYLKSIQKLRLNLEDERKIYSSSVVSINIHEEHQLKFGGDCNERTFKIPLAGGFEITDNVACIRKYFKEGEEIIIAKNLDDWFEKINYYIKNPEKRIPVINAGRKKVLAEHTYHNRVNQIV